MSELAMMPERQVRLLDEIMHFEEQYAEKNSKK